MSLFGICMDCGKPYETNNPKARRCAKCTVDALIDFACDSDPEEVRKMREDIDAFIGQKKREAKR